MADEKSIVELAKERFKIAHDAYAESRRLAREDTTFCLGDSDNLAQWPTEISRSRQTDKKVCLTINQVAQHCNQVINSIRQERPTGKVIPANDGAHKKSAEILEGLIRSIQANSNADDAHDNAAEHAIIGGQGYWRILTEYESDDSFSQVIKIVALPNPQLVHIDPYPSALEPEKCMWGFISEDIPKSQFKDEYPDIDPTDWESDDKGWASDETFRRAEYYYCELVPDTALLLSDGSTCYASKVQRQGRLVSTPQGNLSIIKERPTKRRDWHWALLVGNHPKPVDEKLWAGEYLPIIATYGKWLNVDGKIMIKGEVRDLVDQQRMLNFAFSEAVQTLALQNKIPYVGSAESIEGHEGEWGSANLSNASILTYNATDESGNPLQPPQRQAPPQMAAAQIELLQLSSEQMRAASGQQNANFGIKSEAASGIGIQRLKTQGELATFHFPDNHARGLRYEMKLLVDLIPKIYDTQQIVNVLGLDGKISQATLDPNHPNGYEEFDIGQEDILRVFNPNMGKYDVKLDTGPSFMTQRQEGAAQLNELAGRNPALMQVAGDLIMRAQDFPMAEQLAERLAKALPPGLQDQKGGDKAQLAQATQQAQQAQQQLQMMQQQMQEMAQKLQQAESGQAKAQADIQAKLQMAEMDAKLQESKQEHEAQLKAEQIQREIEARKEQAVIDAQLKQQQAQIDASLAIDKAKQEYAIKLEIAKMDIESKEEIAELNAFVELEKAKIAPPPALAADVNQDLTKDLAEDTAKKPRRKKVTMLAPSGASYTGTIEDDLGE